MNDLSYNLGLIFQWSSLSKYCSFQLKKLHSRNIDLKLTQETNTFKILNTPCNRYSKSQRTAHTSISLEDIDHAFSSPIAASKKIHQCIPDFPNEVKLFSGYITNEFLTKTKDGVASLIFYLKIG